jgi:nitrogen fixation NifU-like protein
VSGGAEDPLGAQVRGLFAALRHAGEAAATASSAVRVLRGEAGREQRGTRVRFTLRVIGERVLEVRFRAYGCPHTLAACEWLAQQLESVGREALGGPAEWARQLGIPAAKLGRLLVIEDALNAALAAADKTVTD